MALDDPRIFELHAGFCKVIANSKRLMIVSLLADGEKSVGELAEALDSPLANVSQHLRILRDHHIVTIRKMAQTVYYRLTDRRLPEACQLIRTILLESLTQQVELACDESSERQVHRIFTKKGR